MKFSVLLPTRNRLDLLARAIETVRRQSHQDWEIIVSDNCSEDDVAGHVRGLGDARIRYFRTPSFLPVTDNWNAALERSSGDYVVMLGDDDGLLDGYFSELARAVEAFGAPELVYTSALLYAYPGVLPGCPEGMLRTYQRRRIFRGAREPFWLEKARALAHVEDSLRFRVTFDYNMQFSLVSRALIDRMRRHGPFYQSPYPDYYASNAMLLEADRVLVVPTPWVAIGISPKSFGYFYFNDSEGAGDLMLNNAPGEELQARLRDVVLPGTTMNTSWLMAMETLARNFAGERSLRVDHARYRLLQILVVYAALLAGRSAGKSYRLLRERMSAGEWLRYGLVLSAVAAAAPARLRPWLAGLVAAAGGSHPADPMPEVPGTFRTLLDVFEQVDPRSLRAGPG